MKMIRQLKTPTGQVKEKVYPKQVNQEGDAERYGEMKAIKKDETIFAAYDKAEMRKAKIMIVANSEFVHFQVSVLAGRHNVGSGRSGPTAIRVNGYRSTKTDGDEPNRDRVCWHQ